MATAIIAISIHISRPALPNKPCDAYLRQSSVSFLNTLQNIEQIKRSVEVSNICVQSNCNFTIYHLSVGLKKALPIRHK